MCENANIWLSDSLERLQELADANADIHLCNEMAVEGAMMLDRMEEEDARRSQR